MKQVLIARTGSLMCAIAIEHVVETLRPLPVEPLGGGPSYVRGVSIIRGEPTIVIDMAMLLATTDSGIANRYVVVRSAGKKAALSFESVSGIRLVEQAAFGELPPLARSVNVDVIAAIGVVDASLVVILEAAKLYPEELR